MRRSVPVLLACVLAACGGGDAPAPSFNTVLHLDPRLEDGSSSAETLALRQRTVTRTRFDRDAHEDWSLASGRVVRYYDDGGGARLSRPQRGPRAPIRLACETPFETDEVDLVEIDLRATEDGRVRLIWTTAATAEPRADPGELTSGLLGSEDVQTVRFRPGRHVRWNGRVTKLEVELEPGAARAVDVREIRLGRLGFDPGFEPLEAASADDATPGDGGLVPFDLEARRAWPADLGVPLVARCTVPDRGLFTASVAAVSTEPAEDGRRVRFLVEARAGGADWKELASLAVENDSGWRELRVDLSAHAGREVDLRLTAVGEAGENAAPGALERARAFFGEPLVLGRAPRTPRPNVLLITLDTLRADHVTDESETPVMLGLAAGGVLFEDAWSACNATTPSHASILTGLYVPEHGAISNHVILPHDVTTLAERFRAAGYHTGALVSVEHLQAGNGFGQGFDRFRQAYPEAHLDGVHTVAPYEDWLDEWAEEGTRPFFLWLHLFDPHTPYLPPAGFVDDYADREPGGAPPRSADPPTLPTFAEGEKVPGDLGWLDDITSHQHVRFLYRAGVAYTDRLMGDVLAALDEHDLRRNTALVVTSDHGEGLSEHDVWYGHAGLFEETLKVPLILAVPGAPRGVRIAEPVQTIDIAPTLMELCGLPPDARQPGVDLLELARAGAGDPARRTWFHYTRKKQVGLREPGTHFVSTISRTAYGLSRPDGAAKWSFTSYEAGTSFLFDLESDPRCLADVAPDRPERVERLLAELEQWGAAMNERRAILRDMSREEIERLNALGYGGDEEEPPPDDAATDGSGG